MLQLFIENQELDVNEAFSHQITYQIDDLRNLDSKTTSFSKTIVLPGTSNNNKLFGNIFEFTNSNFTGDGDNVGYNFNASKSAKAYLTIDGLLAIKGILKLLTIIHDGKNIEYEVAIFGELGGFVSALGNKKLEDLDFSEHNQVYSLTNIVNSWTSNSCVFPLIDYGLVSTDKIDYQYKAFRPALFVKDYISKIIDGAGYTYESNFFETDFFKTLIIPNNRKILSRNSSQGFNVETKRHTYNSGYNPGVPEQRQIDIQYDKNIALGSFSANAGFNEFTYNSATPLIGRFDVNIKLSYTKPTADTLNFKLNLNGNPIIDVFFGDGFSSGSVDQLITIGSITINNGDVLNATIDGQATGSAGFTLNYINTTFAPNNYLKITALAVYDVPVNINEDIIINDTLPQNILQKDFISSIIKMFNLMVVEDKFKDKHLIIEPWVDFYNLDRTSYIDWSDKIDRSQVIKITPMSEINSRYYNFNYRSDNDFYNEEYKKKFNEGYGNLIFDNQLDFAKDSQTTEVVFSATPLIGYPDLDKQVSTLFKKQNNSSTTSVEEQINTNIRILQYNLIEGVDTWFIKNGVSNLDSYDVFPYAGHLDNPSSPNIDLNFGALKQVYFNLSGGTLSNNLFNVYYSSYLAEITDKDSRLISAKIKLNEQDIFNLDFSRFIWIDGVLYRLVRVIDYTPNEICSIELLRVIYSTYAIPETECIQDEVGRCIQDENDNNLLSE